MSGGGQLAEYYARRAGEYERIYAKPERQADLAALRARLAEAFRGRRVLEIACGTGYWTEVIARNAASVTATDFNEEVLTIARAKRLPPGRVKFLQADAYALPAFNESFDTGLAAFWWSHLPKSRLRSFLAGFHGALRPGARVVFIDNSYVEGSSTPIARRDAEGNTYQQRRLNDGSEHEVLKNFPTAEDLRAVVAGMAACVTVELLAYFWLLRYEVRHS